MRPVRLIHQAAIKQRGLNYSCQLVFLVCFTRLTKRDTKLNRLHPVEAGRALFLDSVRIIVGIAATTNTSTIIPR